MLPTPERAGTEGLARAPIIPRPPGAGLGRIAILVGVIPTIRITQPTLVARPFHREGWVYEEKVDGWRMLAYKVAGTVKLVSRNGLDHTRRFPDIVAALRKLDANGLILDGEVAVYDAQLVSRFEWLRHASPPDLSTPPLFMVFDCLQARAGQGAASAPTRGRRAEGVAAGDRARLRGPSGEGPAVPLRGWPHAEVAQGKAAGLSG